MKHILFVISLLSLFATVVVLLWRHTLLAKFNTLDAFALGWLLAMLTMLPEWVKQFKLAYSKDYKGLNEKDGKE